MMKIVFVCTGNASRSAAAEVVLPTTVLRELKSLPAERKFLRDSTART